MHRPRRATAVLVLALVIVLASHARARTQPPGAEPDPVALAVAVTSVTAPPRFEWAAAVAAAAETPVLYVGEDTRSTSRVNHTFTFTRTALGGPPRPYEVAGTVVLTSAAAAPQRLVGRMTVALAPAGADPLASAAATATAMCHQPAIVSSKKPLRCTFRAPYPRAAGSYVAAARAAVAPLRPAVGGAPPCGARTVESPPVPFSTSSAAGDGGACANLTVWIEEDSVGSIYDTAVVMSEGFPGSTSIDAHTGRHLAYAYEADYGEDYWEPRRACANSTFNASAVYEAGRDACPRAQLIAMARAVPLQQNVRPATAVDHLDFDARGCLPLAGHEVEPECHRSISDDGGRAFAAVFAEPPANVVARRLPHPPAWAVAIWTRTRPFEVEAPPFERDAAEQPLHMVNVPQNGTADVDFTLELQRRDLVLSGRVALVHGGPPKARPYNRTIFIDGTVVESWSGPDVEETLWDTRRTYGRVRADCDAAAAAAGGKIAVPPGGLNCSFSGLPAPAAMPGGVAYVSAAVLNCGPTPQVPVPLPSDWPPSVGFWAHECVGLDAAFSQPARVLGAPLGGRPLCDRGAPGGITRVEYTVRLGPFPESVCGMVWFNTTVTAKPVGAEAQPPAVGKNALRVHVIGCEAAEGAAAAPKGAAKAGG